MQRDRHLSSDLASQHEWDVAEALLDTTTKLNIYTPPCESHATCAECQWQFYTPAEQHLVRYSYTRKLNDGEAAAVLNKHSLSIRDDRIYLQTAIQQYGDKILARWKKQSRQKRAVLLQKAKPDLPEHKWPHILYDEHSNLSREQERNLFLLPYLDAETLTENKSILISLLHHRASSNPEDWAPFDNFQLVYGWNHGSFELQYHSGGVVMYGHKYGKLTVWDKHAAHQADMIGFPRGQLVLEAQAHLMGFLRSAVELILETITVDEPKSSAKWTQLTMDGMSTNGSCAYWSKYMYQPYSAPPIFNINSLVDQAKARLEATGDHLWLLQTEPAYMRRYSNLLQQMTVFEVAGREKGIEAIGAEINRDLKMHWFWQGALKDLEHTRNLYYRYRDSIHPGGPLPKAYNNALGALEVLLVNEVRSRAGRLAAVIPQRPGFRHMYELSFDRSTNMIINQIKVGPTSFELFNQDPLLWCLMQLQGAPDDPGRLPYAMLLMFLDDHLAKSPTKEASRLDEVLYDKLSDFAAVVEMLFAVRMHHPKCANRHLDDIRKTEDRLAWKQPTAKVVPSCIERLLGSLLEKFRATSSPSGPMSQQWLQSFNETHEALQQFWVTVSNHYEPQFKGLAIEDIKVRRKPLSHWMSSEYQSRLEAKRQAILMKISKPKSFPSSGLFLPLPSTIDTSPKAPIGESRSKLKTRGKAASTSTTSVARVVEELPTELRATIILPKSTYATIRLMYPVTPEERRKCIDWDAFVLAMKGAGFHARNGGGSMVTFESTSGDGKIIFHRPHPIPKIDPVMMQSMGRRMNKWFGWDRSLFVVSGKE